MNIETLKHELINRLQPLDVEKVILFGSHASGDGTIDSDIDLYVVTKDDFLPGNWREANDVYLRVSRSLRTMRENVPIDLIVHTKEMNKRFIELGSSFSREIFENGIRLI
jgi:predicted nucleotidyltransferase